MASSHNTSPSPTLHDPQPTQHDPDRPPHMNHSASLFRLTSHTSHASRTPPIPGPSAMEPFASNEEEYGAEKDLREWGEEEMDAEGKASGAGGRSHSAGAYEESGKEERPNVPQEEVNVREKRLYSHGFFDKELAPLRQVVFKVIFLTCLISLGVMWTALPIAWGSLWKATSYTNKLDVRVVNRDDGDFGTFMSEGLLSTASLGYYSTPSSDFPLNSDIAHDIVEEGSWGAVVINSGATSALLQARQNGDASYNASRAIDVYYAQARQENAANQYLVPLLQAALEKLCEEYNLNSSGAYISANAGNSTAMALLGQAPSTISNSMWFTMNNVRPFQTVGTAITLLGLIFLLIFSFIMTLTNNATREIIGPYLTTPSFILYRLIVPVAVYLPLSFFFALVDLPFKVHFAAHSEFTYAGGFFLWWFTLFLGMSALGLTTEAVITFLGPRFMPFFLLCFIILNVSITLMPYQLQPWIYKYGLAMPFYHLGRIARTIIFDTRNDIGRSEAVLIGWILVNFVTITVGSCYYRRKAVGAHKQKMAAEKSEREA
ncbi:hypothetical protein IAR50_001838 [Cryptococcus sp. DSM 104548]